MSDNQDQTPAVETEPGTENDTPTVVESAPAQDGDQAADVTLADGSKPPVDENGLPVLDDQSGDDVPESSEGIIEFDASPVLGYAASSGFRGLMAKRAERMRNRPLGTYGTEQVEEEPEEEPDDEAVEDEGYDPDAHTVADVQAYLEQNPDQSGYVLDRERAGKARVTLLGD